MNLPRPAMRRRRRDPLELVALAGVVLGAVGLAATFRRALQGWGLGETP